MALSILASLDVTLSLVSLFCPASLCRLRLWLALFIFRLASCGSSVYLQGTLGHHSYPRYSSVSAVSHWCTKGSHLLWSCLSLLSSGDSKTETLWSIVLSSLSIASCSLLDPCACSTLTCDTQKFFHAASNLVLECIVHCVHYVYGGVGET